MEKLKVESLVSAELRVSNADTEGREYNISAVVRVDNGSVGNVSQGQVSRTDDGSGTGSLATFESWGDASLNVQFQTKDSREAMLAEIEAFIAKCRTDKELSAASVNA